MEFSGQALGMVVADTQAHANAAALAVKGTYKSLGPLVLTIKEAIQAGTLLNTSTPVISGDGDPMGNRLK